MSLKVNYWVTVTYSDALFILLCWHMFDFDLLLQVIHRITQHQIIRTKHKKKHTHKSVVGQNIQFMRFNLLESLIEWVTYTCDIDFFALLVIKS